MLPKNDASQSSPQECLQTWEDISAEENDDKDRQKLTADGRLFTLQSHRKTDHSKDHSNGYNVDEENDESDLEV